MLAFFYTNHLALALMKKISSYWSLLVLIAFNLYFIWYYQQHHDGFKTLLFIYWFQSVMIGFSTFLQLLTLPVEKALEVTIDNGGGTLPAKQGRGCGALFFLVHYGGFHLAYLVFLVIKSGGKLDFAFLKISFAIILIAETMDFIKKYQAAKLGKLNTGFVFLLPYLRIIPMHLMIIGASFSGFSDVTIFLALKMIADVGMHLLTNAMYFSREKSTQ